MFIFTKVDKRIYKLFKAIAEHHNKSVFEFLNVLIIFYTTEYYKHEIDILNNTIDKG